MRPRRSWLRLTILNADHLLEQAERLTKPLTSGPPRQADIRRAVSSAYYSVFHAALTAAGDILVGRTHRSSRRYALVYRGIDHRGLRSLCADARKSPVPNKYKSYLPTRGFGQDLLTFASTVIVLQDARHEADYDPRRRFRASEAKLTVDLARTGLIHWDRVPTDEKATFLTMLAFPPRGL